MKYLRVVSILFQVLIFLSCISFSQGKNQITKQKKDSLQPSKLGGKRTIQDLHREWDSAYQAERKLPLNLMRMGPFLRDLVKRMNAAGITRANARSQNVRKRFSTENMSVDSLGRIDIEAQFKDVDVAKLDRWLGWGVELRSVRYPEGKLNTNVIVKLKSLGVKVEFFRRHTFKIFCGVPFDIVEEFAKDTSMMGMQSLFPSPIPDAGIVTSKGDTILGASKARDYSDNSDNNTMAGASNVQHDANMKTQQLSERSVANPVESIQASTGKKDSLQQSKPEKKRTIDDLRREQDSLYQVEKKLPRHLQLMKRPLRETIKKMKTDGITRENARSKQTARKYSTHFVIVDSIARIATVLYVRDLVVADINQLLSLGVKIKIYSLEMGQVDNNLVEKLKHMGVTILPAITEGPGGISCLIPFDVMEDVAKLKCVVGIETGSQAEHNAGVVTSKGDTVLGAYKARDYFYVTGAGFKIGIISNGVDNWQEFAPPNPNPDLPILQVLSADTGSEGTAMCEIVYDVAPGSSIAFAKAGNDLFQMRASMIALKDSGCKIIVDDVIFPYLEAAFEDGILATQVNSIVAGGVTYISVASNVGRAVYDDFYNPLLPGNLHQFYTGYTENPITVPVNGTVRARLQWTEQWNKSDEDYTFGAYYGNYISIPGTDNLQGISDSLPHEELLWTNNTGQVQTLNFQIGKRSTNEAWRELKMRITIDTSSVLTFRTDTLHIYGHAAADSCISAAAVNAGSIAVANYSAHGPGRIYTYNAGGDPITYNQRSAPTLSATDKVNTRVGQVYGRGFYPFSGTSAAAPHVAGVAALMLSVNPSLTPSQIKSILQNTATPVSGWGGSGRVNAVLALELALPQESQKTYLSNTTLGYLHLFDITTVNPGVQITIPSNKTVIITGTLDLKDANSTVIVNGTLILEGTKKGLGKVIVKKGGRQIILKPSIIQGSVCDVINGTLQFDDGMKYSMLENSSIVVDSGVIDMGANDTLFANNSTQLKVLSGGQIRVPSTDRIISSGTVTVDVGGAMSVLKGGTLSINAGGQLQLLAGGSGSVTVDSSGQVICYGTITVSDTLYTKKNGIVQIQSGGQLTLNSGGAVILDTSAQFTDYGTVTVNNGGIIDARKSVNIIIQNSGTLRTNQGGLINTIMSGGIDCYGTLSTNSTINSDGLITVRSGGKLKADSSSLFRMGYNGYVNIYGSIVARGTATKKILFTSSNPNPTPGAWNRIYLLGGPDTLRYCDISYATYGVIVNSTSGTTIENCNISNCSYYGVYAYNSFGIGALRLKGTILTNNADGLGMGNAWVSLEPSAQRNTQIYSNTQQGIYNGSGDLYMGRTTIHDNGSSGIWANGYGANVWLSANGVQLGWDTVSNNYDEITVDNGAVVNIGKRQVSCCCLSTSLAGLNTAGCPSGCPPCWLDFWGYNSIWGNHYWVDNSTGPIYAHLTYWGAPPSICDYNSIPSSQFVGTVYKQYNLCGEELMAVGNRESRELNSSQPPETGTVESVINYLENLITAQPDSAEDALQILLSLVGPGGKYVSTLSVPWETFLIQIAQTTPSEKIRNRAIAYLISLRMHAKDYDGVISLANNTLTQKPGDNLWFYCQRQIISAACQMGDLTGADKAYSSISSKGTRIDPQGMSDLRRIIDMTRGNIVSSQQPASDKGNTSSTSATLEDGLSSNYPNPFNPVTTISYTLAKDMKVSLKVYNVLGQVVATLVNGNENAGNKSVRFDAKNLPSGIYFYHLEATNINDPSKVFTQVKKMIVLK